MQQPIEILNVGTDWIAYTISLIGIFISGFFSYKLYMITKETRDEQQKQKRDLSNFYFNQAKRHAGKMLEIVKKNYVNSGEVDQSILEISRHYNIPDHIFDVYFDSEKRDVWIGYTHLDRKIVV